MKNRSTRRLALFALMCAPLAGCGGRADGGSGSLTQAKFDQVKEGMSLKEAEGVLGPGTAIKTDEIDKMSLPADAKVPFGIIGKDGKSKSVSWVRWGDKQKYILLGFLDEKLAYKLKNGL